MKHTQWSMPLNYGKKYEIQTMGPGICQQVAVINDVVDARLIAAAPELLEALKILVSQYEDSGDFTMGGRLTNEGFLKGKAALEKVEGTK